MKRLRSHILLAATVGTGFALGLPISTAAAADTAASCVGQIISAAAPVIVPFGTDVVTVQVAASDNQFGQTVASVTAMQPRNACRQP